MSTPCATPSCLVDSRWNTAIDLQCLNDRGRSTHGTVKHCGPQTERFFGSVLHGTDCEDSDLDLLVDALPGATLFDLGGLQNELETLLGIGVQVVTPGDLPPKCRAQVLAEAQPI